MDEALGKKVDPVPFRGPTSSGASSVTRVSRRSYGKLLFVLGAVSALAVGLDQLGLLRTYGRTATPTLASRERDFPPPGIDEQRRRLLPTPVAPAEPEGLGYRFLEHRQGTTTPVTWDPCRPIRYVVRADHAPAGGEALLHSAFDTVSQVTGLRFQYAGPTSEGPTERRSSYQRERYGDRWAPVLVVWATPVEVPDFGADLAGEAGPQGVGARGDETYVSGTVMLSAGVFQKLTAEGRGDAARAIVLHELGHLVGLAHAPDATQIMFARNAGSLTLGAGDLAGLAAVGQGPCRPEI